MSIAIGALLLMLVGGWAAKRMNVVAAENDRLAAKEMALLNDARVLADHVH